MQRWGSRRKAANSLSNRMHYIIGQVLGLARTKVGPSTLLNPSYLGLIHHSLGDVCRFGLCRPRKRLKKRQSAKRLKSPNGSCINPKMDLVGCWALPLSELISTIWCMRFGREFAAFVLDKPHSCMATLMQKHLPIHKQSSMGVRWDKTVSK